MGFKRAPVNKMWVIFECLKYFWVTLIGIVLLLTIFNVAGVWKAFDESLPKKRISPLQEQVHLRTAQQAQMLQQEQQLQHQPDLQQLQQQQQTDIFVPSQASPPAHSLHRGSTSGGSHIVSEVILSLGRPVISDVRGNLGTPNVVTEESTTDWLTDRWQSSRNMQGEPIPGEHFLEIDLQRLCTVTKIVLDWESAYCNSYTLLGHNGLSEQTGQYIQPFAKIGTFRDARSSEQTQKHVLHEILVKHSASKSQQYRYVRLIMHGSATQWGPSLWRFQVYGWPGDGLTAET